MLSIQVTFHFDVEYIYKISIMVPASQGLIPQALIRNKIVFNLTP